MEQNIIFHYRLSLHVFNFIYKTFKTATSTRSQVQKNNITSTSQPISQADSTTNSQARSTTTMTDQTFLSKARKARFEDLPTFSGHASEDAERFLKRIKTTINPPDDSDNHEFLEIVRGKLIRSAGLWFDTNEYTFKKWSDFETAFRSHYFPTTIGQQIYDRLRSRQQKPDESVTSYIDAVIQLCRELDTQMPDKLIIHHLMGGLNPLYKRELSRHISSIQTVHEFLQYAKLEQDLYTEYDQYQNSSFQTQQSYFNSQHTAVSSLATRMKQPQQHYYNRQQNNRSSFATKPSKFAHPWNSATESQHQKSLSTAQQHRSVVPPQPSLHTQQTHAQPTSQRSFTQCKVCARKNHRTIDCFYKRTTGCFNCGQNHKVRDCTLAPNFQ